MVTTPPINNHHHHHNPPSPSMATYDDNEDGAYNGVKESSPSSYYQRRGQSNNKKNGVSSFFNFSSPPCFTVQWGRQKYLRCSNQPSSPPQPPPSRNHNPDLPSSSRSTEEGNNGGGSLEAVSEKLVSDFRAEAQQMQADLLKKSDVEGETKPWNLRTRRSFCKQPKSNSNSNANAVNNGGHRKPISLPAEINGVKRGVVEVKRKRPSFSLSLSKKDIEHDFLIFAEVRPSRRPKKRSKTVQKQIDGIFPGLWLSEITADMYKVNEQPENGKSQR